MSTDPPDSSQYAAAADVVAMALYTALYAERDLAVAAGRVVAGMWRRNIAVIDAGHHGLMTPDGPAVMSNVWALFDLAEDGTGEVRRRAVAIVRPRNGN